MFSLRYRGCNVSPRKRRASPGCHPIPNFTSGASDPTVQNVYWSVYFPVQHKPTVRTFVRSFRHVFATSSPHCEHILVLLGELTQVTVRPASIAKPIVMRVNCLHATFTILGRIPRLHPFFIRVPILKHAHLMRVHQHARLLVDEISAPVGNALGDTRLNAFLFGIPSSILRVLGGVLPCRWDDRGCGAGPW